jgi:transcription elongation GreA/GreB family factor
MNRKAILKTELVALLQEGLTALENAHRATRAGATHEEAKPENDKDTRALEQSYLARGQAIRVDELRSALLEVEAMPTREWSSGEKVALGALVTVEESGAVATYWIASHGGGSRLDRASVHVVTPASPIGRALVGKTVGEELELAVGRRTRALAIVRVE